ncbi:alpha/beta fold hydrolase [Algoriphagus aestuariicola]|uniref:Alpha/beta fold hydrolase n=1 Tax=Algoriphagus aestuariicola TaxID=1852016 RepID=A0ABS3BR92_9BACT|nr:alpha/beta fold hydrolase [Algoriphagus aestuariicola]MBN7801349.1 alpha/beta fold hydrolase [Algoriphagus aestuariicola]
MPLTSDSLYQRPNWLFSGHLETIYPALFRKVEIQKPKRERIETPDGDFLDLDWFNTGSTRLVIVSHGLEGNSTRPYMLGMAREFTQKDFDVLTWNFRGCSGEMNRKAIFYHSGATYDLDTVVRHAQADYQEIYLVGFSLGGNLTLKYLGEQKSSNPKIKKGIAISVPLDLAKSCEKISTGENIIYSRRFLVSLKEKVQNKSSLFPGEISPKALRKIKTLREFDDIYTGPLHGFSNATEYYRVNSSLQFLELIEVPTLVLNAQNDPFLSDTCFPTEMANRLEQVHFEFPKHGGHVGFTGPFPEKTYYSERRAVEFITFDL